MFIVVVKTWESDLTAKTSKHPGAFVPVEGEMNPFKPGDKLYYIHDWEYAQARGKKAPATAEVVEVEDNWLWFGCWRNRDDWEHPDDFPASDYDIETDTVKEWHCLTDGASLSDRGFAWERWTTLAEELVEDVG